MAFLTYYIKMLLLTAVLPLVFGLAVGLFHRLFCLLVGNRCALPLLFATHVVIVPIREFFHLVAAFVCLHRVDDFRLLQLHDPEGEIGFVEHSYNRKNPFAVFGNFLFAILPAAGGLLLVLSVVRLCFPTAFAELVDAFGVLVRNPTVGVGDFFKATQNLLPTAFQSDGSNVLLKIVGCFLLTVLSLEVYVSLRELFEGASGFGIYAIAALAVAVATFFTDVRVQEMVTDGIYTFFANVAALFATSLIFNIVVLIPAVIVFIYRKLRGESETGTACVELVPYEEEP